MNIALNWLTNLVFVIFGVVFLYAALNIGESFSGGSGHRVLPIFLSTSILILSIIVFARELIRGSVADVGNHPITAREFLLHAVPLILLMFLNGFGQIWFGYVASTFFCGALVFRLFGNNWFKSFLHGAIGSIVLYGLFFRLMGLYSQPGSIIDLALPF